MDDNDDLIFSFEDEEDEDMFAAEDEEAAGEEQSNRGFIIGIVVLAVLFLVGVAAIVALVLSNRGGEPAVSANELTNQANMTLIAATQTAEFEAGATEEEGAEGLPPATAPGEEEAATEVAEVTEAPTEEATEEVTEAPTEEMTEEATEAPTEEATAEAEATEVAEVTEEATAEEATEETPAFTEEGTEEAATEVAGVEGEDGQGGGGPEAVEEGAETLPETGLATGVGLAGAGVLALVLIGVVVAARRIRLG
jgi:outer membrane biosynthesis protein TonB